VGGRHDRRGAEPAVAGGHVEVELRRPAVAESLVQGDGAGNEAGRVEREHRRPGLSRQPLEGDQHGARGTKPACGGMDGERASAGPAGRPGEALERGVRVERQVGAEMSVCLDDEQAPEAGVFFQIEQVSQVGQEDLPGDLGRVLAVRRDHDAADGRIVRWHRIANDRRGFRPGCYGGFEVG
jgi:hypothetical protein